MTEAELLALHLVARGRLLPTVTADGYAAWRVGPLDPSDVDRMRRLGITRGQLDQVADRLAREPGATTPFADPVPHHVPELRDWAAAIAAEHDRSARVSLRVELTGDALTAVLQVHSMAEPGVVADAAAVWAGEVFEHQERLDAVLEVRRAAQAWAPLARLLELAVPDQLELSDDEVRDLAGGGEQALAAAGVPVHWPRELDRDVTASALVGGTELPSFFDGVLDFSWQVAAGGAPLTEAEMDLLAEAHRPVVRLRDRWTLVAPDIARLARDRVLKPLTAVEALGAALTGRAHVDGEWVPVAASRPLELLRDKLSSTETVDQPAALTATLRDYQLRGLRWLARMTELRLGGCLADDMGLGKTITLIALHLHRAAGPTLVVCPASLLGNWEREIRRFAPGVPVHRYHGGGRAIVDTEGFVLTTYGTMRLDADELSTVDWDLVVADEAQHVKNPRSDTARALRRISATARVALTGTPVENNLSELWAILDWTTPGLLGSLGEFRARWAQPVESGDQVVAAHLTRLITPFLLRRRKSDPGIAPELPPKTETDRPVGLTREQAGLYEAVVRETMARIRETTGMQRKGLVLKLLTALKQVCNHPAQYLGEKDGVLPGRSGKLELLDELVDTIRAEGGGLLVFTQYVTMARLLERHLGERGVPTQLLHGGTPVRQRDELVRAFQESAEPPVFLLSLKAAGTGLNLTRADHVVHYDRWWNPAVEAQATDRAYRIGQDRPVQVHRLIAEGTLEDRIATMLAAKKELADAVLGKQDDAELTELSDAQLAELVELREAL
ncbi:DEAD/DEAH box helicase [Actinophytocola algeriensis]|uniref:Superfamily II DNA or RNA helicase n=1 Tax=Actinophytocola algeriensis TaxID=1768010 RepID=A0A7W7PZI3_9PSEU|nr:DEAD/DEAH box helicase [Actinophytocola algeriensis]MBB4904210.1 superfamily II DNA or RNA helicase [Actinophytocola algeriensis]MBE1476933.1 superfamily II DNA or RNA helicase [Actinophytocola algeriensis]